VVTESSAPLLSIKGLSVRFGAIVALDNVSFDVKAKQICGLIGPNGAARDNILIGGHCRRRVGFVANALRLPTVGREERLLNQRTSGLLQMLHLASVADLPVSGLPLSIVLGALPILVLVAPDCPA
jgi:ABC-type branched-subunit amino acid transport system ATPase component